MANPVGTFTLYKGTNLVDSVGDYNTILNTQLATYLSGKAIGTRAQQMYTRIDNGRGSVKVDISADIASSRSAINKNNIMCADYLKITNNSDYENITYYCFIDDVKYINENVYEVIFHEDSYQTWIASATFKKTMIERRTVADDTLFSKDNNTSDIFDGELHGMYHGSLATSVTGDYAVLCTSDCFYFGAAYGEAVKVNWTHEDPKTCGVCGNRPEFFYYYCAKLNKPAALAMLLNMASAIVSNPETRGAFLAMYVSPAICLPDGAVTLLNAGDAVLITPPRTDDISEITEFTQYHGYLTNHKRILETLSLGTIQNYAFEGYTPKNKKMYNSPYMLVKYSNNAGASISVQPQYMSIVGSQFYAYVFGVMSQAPIVTLMPLCEGSGQDANTDLQLSLNAYPQLPVTADAFLGWYSQLKYAAIELGVNAVTSAAKGGIVGAAAGIIESGVSALESAMKSAFEADTCVNNVSGDLFGIATGLDAFKYEVMSISKASAMKIDDYFSRYGYYIGRLEDVVVSSANTVTGLNGRPAWNYTKTSKLAISGNIPIYAKNAICNIIDNGLRVWDSSKYLDYAQSNTPT